MCSISDSAVCCRMDEMSILARPMLCCGRLSRVRTSKASANLRIAYWSSPGADSASDVSCHERPDRADAPSHPIPLISTQKAADANGLANGPNLPCDLDFRRAGAGDKPPVLCDGLDYVHTCTVTAVGMRPLGCNRHRTLQHGVPCSKIARCCNMVCRVSKSARCCNMVCRVA
jgi:hypothetical protein